MQLTLAFMHSLSNPMEFGMHRERDSYSWEEEPKALGSDLAIKPIVSHMSFKTDNDFQRVWEFKLWQR